jgi:hypothetical protein
LYNVLWQKRELADGTNLIFLEPILQRLNFSDISYDQFRNGHGDTDPKDTDARVKDPPLRLSDWSALSLQHDSLLVTHPIK